MTAIKIFHILAVDMDSSLLLADVMMAHQGYILFND
jgi:hypothetical protein